MKKNWLEESILKESGFEENLWEKYMGGIWIWRKLIRGYWFRGNWLEDSGLEEIE